MFFFNPGSLSCIYYFANFRRSWRLVKAMHLIYSIFGGVVQGPSFVVQPCGLPIIECSYWSRIATFESFDENNVVQRAGRVAIARGD